MGNLKIKSIFSRNWYLIIIIIILLGVIIFCSIPKMDIENNYIGAILGFVGIMATFIVVGNYALVYQIRKDFDSSINNLELRIKEFENIDENIKKQDSIWININIMLANMYFEEKKYYKSYSNYLNALFQMIEVNEPNVKSIVDLITFLIEDDDINSIFDKPKERLVYNDKDGKSKDVFDKLFEVVKNIDTNNPIKDIFNKYEKHIREKQKNKWGQKLKKEPEEWHNVKTK